jgi:hypothetical protein
MGTTKREKNVSQTNGVVSEHTPQPQSETDSQNVVDEATLQTINGSSHVVSEPAKPDPQAAFIKFAPQISSVTKDFDLDSLAKIAMERSFVPVDLGIETVLIGSPRRAVSVHPCVKKAWAIPGDFNRRTDTWLVAEEIATLPHNRSVVCPVALLGCVEPLMEDAIWPIYTLWVIKLGGARGAAMSKAAKSALERVKIAIAEGGWWGFWFAGGSGGVYMSGRPEKPILDIPKWPSETTIDPLIDKGFEETGHIIRTDDHPELVERRFRP